MPLIHPDLAASLATSGHFPATGTVQVETVTVELAGVELGERFLQEVC